MTGSRAGTQSEETLYVQGTKARGHLFALELRPSPALTGPGAIHCSRAMPTEEPTPQSSPRRLPFLRFRPVSTHRLPFLLRSHHRRRVNDALHVVPVTRPPSPTRVPSQALGPKSQGSAADHYLAARLPLRLHRLRSRCRGRLLFSTVLSLSLSTTDFSNHYRRLSSIITTTNSNRRFALRSHDHR